MEEEDHKRSRHRYEFVIHEGGDLTDDELKEGGVSSVEPNRKKRRTIESVEVGSAHEFDTMEGLPLEMVHAIMSFTGMRELLSMGRTSKTHREILKMMMGRTGEADPSPKIHFRTRSYAGPGFLVNSDCLVSFPADRSNISHQVMKINDVEMKDNPIGTDSMIVNSPSIVWSPSKAKFFKIEGYRVSDHRMKGFLSHWFTLVMSVYRTEGIRLHPSHHMNEYGCITLLEPIEREKLLEILDTKNHPQYEMSAGKVRKSLTSDHLTAIGYTHNDTTISIIINKKINRAIIINRECFLINIEVNGKNFIQKREKGTNKPLWTLPVYSLTLESACEIVNGIILISVIHPIEMRRTVFAIERGPSMKRAFHLRAPIDAKNGIIKRMAYEDGVLAMVLGPSDIDTSYDRVLALDILKGETDEYVINANATTDHITQAKGLQFMIGYEYIRIVRL